METKAGKIGVAKAARGGIEGRKEKEARRKEKEKERKLEI